MEEENAYILCSQWEDTRAQTKWKISIRNKICKDLLLKSYYIHKPKRNFPLWNIKLDIDEHEWRQWYSWRPLHICFLNVYCSLVSFWHEFSKRLSNEYFACHWHKSPNPDNANMQCSKHQGLLGNNCETLCSVIMLSDGWRKSMLTCHKNLIRTMLCRNKFFK